MLAERKANLQDQYANLWIDGDTNVVVCSVLVPDSHTVDQAATQLFYNNYIADVFEKSPDSSKTERGTVEGHKMVWERLTRAYFVTASWHVPNVMSVLQRELGTDEFDLTVLEAKTGNKHYIKWVQ